MQIRPRFSIASFMTVIAIFGVLLAISHSALAATVLFCLLSFYFYVHRLTSGGPSLPQRKTLEDLAFLRWENTNRPTSAP
jgi:hypothetical protein